MWYRETYTVTTFKPINVTCSFPATPSFNADFFAEDIEELAAREAPAVNQRYQPQEAASSGFDAGFGGGAQPAFGGAFGGQDDHFGGFEGRFKREADEQADEEVEARSE